MSPLLQELSKDEDVVELDADPMKVKSSAVRSDDGLEQSFRSAIILARMRRGRGVIHVGMLRMHFNVPRSPRWDSRQYYGFEWVCQ
jgi:hypothetical protein